jgi:hypothetical protein
VFAYELFDLTNDTIQFVDEIGMIAVLPKRGHQSPIVPNGALFFSTEPLEYLQAVSPKVGQNCTRVVQLI